MSLERKVDEITTPTQKLNAFVDEFCREKREEMRLELQKALQAKIEVLEAGYKHPKQKRSKQFQTPFGTIELIRRAYPENGRYVCKADQELGLPQNGWFTQPEKWASALGVTTEFAHACELFKEMTGIQLSDHGLANRVEAVGQMVHEIAKSTPAKDVSSLDSALYKEVCRARTFRPVLYAGVDGIMVPMKQGGGSKEAKVGVVFWEHSHCSLSAKRKEIRNKDYVATLESREDFGELMFKCFANMANQRPCQTVFLGDGAKWIWEMAEENYPDAVQILDFYHVSEYVWDVARELHPSAPEQQREWVQPQLKRLKESRWQDVVESLRFLKGSPALEKAIQSLKRYLKNNANRIDYKTYREMGYMIGTGVVESSNRRIVTQRLKQAGMHWSEYGANTVMALRACYLSTSNLWDELWKLRAV